MAETPRIIELTAHVMDGHPWHGSSIAALLKGVTAEDAAAHPVAGAHSIWELVRHMTSWAQEVRARVAGESAGTPAAGNWPRVGKVTEERWAEAKAGLFEAYRQLSQDVASLRESDLQRPVTDTRQATPGMSRYLTIHGVIHHAAYHSGQIAMLRRALRTSGR